MSDAKRLVSNLISRRVFEWNLRQDEVGAALGFKSQSHISDWETFRRTPDVESLARWGRALGLRLVWEPLEVDNG